MQQIEREINEPIRASPGDRIVKVADMGTAQSSGTAISPSSTISRRQDSSSRNWARTAASGHIRSG
jgi:hypothetical protein